MTKYITLKLISLSLIFFLLSMGLSPSAYTNIEKSNHTFDDDIRFLCYDNDGFNEEKYQRYLRMFEEKESSVHEEQTIYGNTPKINNDPVKNAITNIFGPMDSGWPMKCYNNRHTGLSPFSTTDNNGVELWRYKANGWIEGGPVIDNDGTIYFGDYDGCLNALNPDGSLKWKYDIGYDWISSTPTISEDGTIYFGSWDGYLYALNPDGSLKWKFYSKDVIFCSPAIANDGTIYFGIMGSPDDGGGLIYAVNPDGTCKWFYETGYHIICDPAIGDDGTLYIGSGDTYLYAMNPNGTLKWRFKTDYYIKGPTSISDDGGIYFGSWDGYLYALDPDGSLKWKCEIGAGTETNPSIGPDGTIYVGNVLLYAFNPDGTLKWTFDLGEDQDIFQSSPAVSAEGTIYVGTNIDGTFGGDIIAIDLDGNELWRHRIANDWVDSSPCIGENGIVYIGSSSTEEESPGHWTDVGYLYKYGPGEPNNPPNTPTITGPTSGKIGRKYSYGISTTDPDDDNIELYIDWGDDYNSGWIGPYKSGDEIIISHTWDEEGTYTIKAQAMDNYGDISDWVTLEVSMPKNKGLQQYYFFEKLLELFPLLKQLFL